MKEKIILIVMFSFSNDIVQLTIGVFFYFRGDTPKVKNDKLSPPASHESPNAHKKSANQYSVKSKKEGQHSRPHTSIKRSADDTSAPKPKKKKSEKHDHVTNPNAGLKEISILSPSNENDALKAKSMHSVKKLKEDRARRKSVDGNEPVKHSKDGKHKSKDIKVKKEKSFDLGGGGIPKLKFSIKRTLDESWATTVKEGASNTEDNSTENITNTIVTNNTTTAALQNDHVKKIMAEFAQQDSDDDGAEEDKTMNSSMSSNGSIESHSSSKIKKSKSKSKSSTHSHSSKSKSKENDRR